MPATFTAELAGGEQAGEQAEVSVTVHSVKVKEPARARRRVRAVGERVRHPRRVPGRDPHPAGIGQADAAGGPGPGAGARRAAGQARHPAAGAARRLRDRAARALLDEQLERVGATRDSYLASRDLTAGRLCRDEIAADARRFVKAGFVLDQIARSEELGIEQEELNAYIVEQAYRLGVPPTGWPRRSSTGASSASRSRRCCAPRHSTCSPSGRRSPTRQDTPSTSRRSWRRPRATAGSGPGDGGHGRDADPAKPRTGRRPPTSRGH